MENQEFISKIDIVFSHIQLVQHHTYVLGIKLIKGGEVELGRNLISNGQIHDNSKFKGIEFDHLFNGDPLLSEVVKHHQSVNPHHPEYWGGIHNMPKVYVAEMVCDWLARANEFGTNIRDWIENQATERFEFTNTDIVYTNIQKYLNLLLDKSFQ
jgi:hypothetical protein